MANSVGLGQRKQSDLGLHCLLRPVCSNTLTFYGNMITDTYPILVGRARTASVIHYHNSIMLFFRVRVISKQRIEKREENKYN